LALESIDDSDGWLGQTGADLAGAHLDACRAARPDPEEFARWLVGHALDDIDDGLTGIDPLDYEDVLGDKGMALLRKSAIEAWQRNWPPRKPLRQPEGLRDVHRWPGARENDTSCTAPREALDLRTRLRRLCAGRR
jgi:hypothetical protein